MGNIVLVHGTYAGGFLWRNVADRLRERGHRVWAPSLTGLGERTHLNGPGVGLDTHITDIENLLFYEDIRDATIVGFSYGGMVLAGLGADACERVSATVLLDAALPEDGESIHDVYSHVGTDTLPEEIRELQATEQRPEIAPDLEVPAWLSHDPRMSPMPGNCHWDQVRLGPLFTESAGHYIQCVQWTMNSKCADRAARLGWTVWQMDAPHDAMDTDPEGLTELIHTAATRSVEASAA